jgi:hypothetical protein
MKWREEMEEDKIWIDVLKKIEEERNEKKKKKNVCLIDYCVS